MMMMMMMMLINQSINPSLFQAWAHRTTAS